MNLEVLNGLITPKSVAVIGASTTSGKIGHTVLKNLKESEYQGDVFPVNPKADEILGYKCYSSILEIDDPIDAAIIVIPAKYVSQVVDQCGVKGVKGLIIIQEIKQKHH